MNDERSKPLHTYQLKSKPHCVSCNALLDGATVPRPRDTKPAKPGDYTVCAYCGECMRFGEQMQLHRMTGFDWLIAPKEMVDLRDKLAPLRRPYKPRR